jgi:hypothetical protein
MNSRLRESVLGKREAGALYSPPSTPYAGFLDGLLMHFSSVGRELTWSLSEMYPAEQHSKFRPNNVCFAEVPPDSASTILCPASILSINNGKYCLLYDHRI